MEQTNTDLIFDKLRRQGWSVGTFGFVSPQGVLWSADVTKGDGKRIVVQAKGALLELERQCAEDASADAGPSLQHE